MKVPNHSMFVMTVHLGDTCSQVLSRAGSYHSSLLMQTVCGREPYNFIPEHIQILVYTYLPYLFMANDLVSTINYSHSDSLRQSFFHWRWATHMSQFSRSPTLSPTV